MNYKEEAINGFKESIENLEKRLAKVQTGRANPRVLDGVMAEYYGTPTPLNQVATVSVQEGRNLVIKPFDKAALKGIEKGINEANLGFNPVNDGECVRINIPPLTEESRKERVKTAKAIGEEAKISIRNTRANVLKNIKENDDLSEDDKEREEKLVQDEVDKFNKKIDEIIDNKEKELLTV